MIFVKGRGRLGNKFFRNTYAYFLGLKWGIGNIKYENPEHFTPLFEFPPSKPIDLPQPNPGQYSFRGGIALLDDKLIDRVLSLPSNHQRKGTKVVISDQCFCQTTWFASYLLENFASHFQKQIEKNNKFKERYNNNNDFFIHYRLGDTEKLGFSNPLSYYEKSIEECLSSPLSSDKEENKNGKERKGYIATDSPNHPNIKHLAEKYKLTLITYNEYDTLLFGSTCKDIILSLGTYSWMLSLFAFYSENIYFMNPKCVKYWHGPIFEAFPSSLPSFHPSSHFSSHPSSHPSEPEDRREERKKYHCITLDLVR